MAGVDSPSDLGRLHPEALERAAELGGYVTREAAERAPDGRSSDEGV